ncbi:MAG TPA: fatty acid desaturase [Rhizomicrobium sp.]|jgi:omega-6 fatty acid desaturase (delta-12 desaturase)|nr:fatty acid desaturase [Rhizomicrobium sp.]
MSITSPNGRVQARNKANDLRSVSRGLLLFAVHAALYVATLLGAIANFAFPVSTLFAAANGFFIALLFIIGHDASHGSFAPDPRWNRWFARLAFIPCVHAPSLWRRTHNDMHHQRTNLKGVDHVWAPMSKAEYDAASPARRWLERVYRGPWGPLIYYYGTFWLYRMLVPIAPEVRAQWKRHVPDSVFALVGFVLTLAAIGFAGHALAPQRPLWMTYLTGWVLPFAVWNYLMGLTIYLNHTHPAIPWFGNETMWSSHRGNVLSTVHVKLPRYIAPLYSDALAHTAHHADISLPVYELPAAQAKLKSAYGKAVQEYTLSIAEYRKIYAACKLFDFERMCWTDFDGRPTAITWAAHAKQQADQGVAARNAV